MNKRIIKQLFKKEMLDVLRDKKTVLMMVVVPLIIYPLIIIFSMQIMTSVTQDMAKSTYRVAIGGEYRSEYVKLLESTESEEYSFEIKLSDGMETDLQNGEIDLYITAEDVFGEEVVYVYYLSASTKSSYGLNIVLDKIEERSQAKTEELLVDAGLEPEEVLEPIRIGYIDHSTAEESTGSLLGSILPFMLVVSILMGTMYPAIDTTSGEKERGTLETVLTLPVSSRELIFSKFLAVGLFGIVSALLNMISMCGVMAYLFNMMESLGAETFGDFDLSKFIPPMIIGILCVFAFAVFVSALSMCVCAFAKSYKEANNYITPVMLVVMLASFISFIPNIELTKTMALVPVANICLLLRDLLVFKFNYLNIMIVLFSNIIYGVVSVLVLGRIYNSESIMFGDGQSGIQLFERRSNMKKGGVPTLGDCGFVIIIMTLVYLYVGSSLQLRYGMAGLVESQLLFVIVPLITLLYSKKSVTKSLKLKLCKPSKVLGGVLFGIGTIVWSLIISMISTSIFRESAQSAENGLMSYIGDTFWVSLLVIAVTPAICEELFFRGYVFATLENRLKISSAIILSAALFGAFHMSLAKFFTTAFLGGAIAYVGYKTKSIFPGMIIHFLNNAFSCVTLYYPVVVIKILPVLSRLKSTRERLANGALIIVVAIICTIVGVVLLKKEDSYQNTQAQE